MAIDKDHPDAVRAGIRNDFMRRLFAVAISVGAAAGLLQMDWIRGDTVPTTQKEWEQIFVFLVGLTATIASWDGYLLSIDNKPLYGIWRFVIDIALVFIYMFMLLSSGNSFLLLIVLSVIYFLYFLWDILTVREHPLKYNSHLKLKEREPASFADIARVYRDGFKTSGDTKRGPIITFLWMIYFLLLMAISLAGTPWYETFVASLAAFAGIVAYRADKSRVNGFSMGRRLLIIALLLAISLGLLVIVPNLQGSA